VLPGSISRHLHHHLRFYAALAAGLAVWAVLQGLAPSLSLVAAGDAFFGIYLASTVMFVTRLKASDIRKRASVEDEGIVLVVLITLTAISLSIASIFAILSQVPAAGALQLGLAIASVPLGWLTFHSVAALRYAHLYYARSSDEASGTQDAGGLAFPGTREPGAWDFFYYAFVVGMTAQVSDVQVLNTRMRRLTLAHGLASFIFNTVILALAVNMAVAHSG